MSFFKKKKSTLLFLLFITTVIISELSLSRYSSAAAFDSSVSVALMANDVEVLLPSPDDFYPGAAPFITRITITNEEDNEVCEVTENFTIKIVTGNNLNIPFTYQLCSDASCNNILTSDANNIYSSSNFTFNAGVSETKQFYLKVVWPLEQNNYSYSNEIDFLKLIINVNQVD